MGGAAATFTVYAVTGAIYRRPMPAPLPAVHADLRSEGGAGKVHRAQTRQRRSGNKALSPHPPPLALPPDSQAHPLLHLLRPGVGALRPTPFPIPRPAGPSRS